HGAVVHHAVLVGGDDFLVAGTAGLFGDAEIAGVDEADELGGFVVEEDGGVGGVGGALPEDGVAGGDVGLGHGEAGGGVAAVAIDAAEHDVGGGVHVLDALVALDATGAFAVGLGVRLVDPIGLGEVGVGIGRGCGRLAGGGDGGAVDGVGGGGGRKRLRGGSGDDDKEHAPGGEGDEGPAEGVSGIEAHGGISK